jgi:hypothetical protein
VGVGVYGRSDGQGPSFLSTTRAVLKGAASVAEKLKQYSSSCFGGVSRVLAHLELAYHQVRSPKSLH